jgi:hypothetical protein
METQNKKKGIVGYENIDYRTFIEKLKTELGSFLRYADRASVVPYAGLKARTQSKRIEKLLLMYRKLSRVTDKRNKLIVKEAKKEIKNLTK